MAYDAGFVCCYTEACPHMSFLMSSLGLYLLRGDWHFVVVDLTELVCLRADCTAGC